MAAVPSRIDGVGVRESDSDLTLSLCSGGVHVLLLRLYYDGLREEVIVDLPGIYRAG